MTQHRTSAAYIPTAEAECTVISHRPDHGDGIDPRNVWVYKSFGAAVCPRNLYWVHATS
jgi:hypothetical protein